MMTKGGMQFVFHIELNIHVMIQCVQWCEILPVLSSPKLNVHVCLPNCSCRKFQSGVPSDTDHSRRLLQSAVAHAPRTQGRFGSRYSRKNFSYVTGSDSKSIPWISSAACFRCEVKDSLLSSSKCRRSDEISIFQSCVMVKDYIINVSAIRHVCEICQNVIQKIFS